MSSAAPLLDRNLVSPQNLMDPAPLYRELREHDPVHWSDTINAWFLSRHDDVTAAFLDPRLSAERWKFFEYQIQGLPPDVIEEFMQLTRDQMVMREGAEHVRIRRQAGVAFTPVKLDELKPAIRRTMQQLLDRVHDQRRMNLARDISYQLPTLVIADLLGVPTRDRERFQHWSSLLADFATPAAGANMLEAARGANRAMAEMRDYFLPLIEERRHQPGPDALSHMIRAQEEGRMTPRELLSNAILILFAGHTTTTDQLSNCVHELLRHPEQLARLRAEPRLLGATVEESLRFRPAVPSVFRIAVEPLELRGKRIRPGDVVFLCMAAANRDPAVFPHPDTFDITRDPHAQRHIAFGSGPHHCMGASLARRETEIGVSMLLEQLPGLRLDDTQPARVKCHSLNFRGLDVLPVCW